MRKLFLAIALISCAGCADDAGKQIRLREYDSTQAATAHFQTYMTEYSNMLQQNKTTAAAQKELREHIGDSAATWFLNTLNK